MTPNTRRPRWRSLAILLTLSALLFALAACGNDDDDPGSDPGQTPGANGDDASATGTPEFQDGTNATPIEPDRPNAGQVTVDDPAHQDGTTTGDPALDETIAAIESGSLDALTERMRFESLACTAAGGDSPRCPTGTAPGTAVEALPTFSCTPGYTVRDTLERTLRGLTDGRFGLYAAYSQPDAAIPGDAAIVLVQRVEGFALVLHADAGTIVAMTSPCEIQTPAELLDEAGITEFLLDPPADQ